MRWAVASPSHAMTWDGMCFQKSTWNWATNSPPHHVGRSDAARGVRVGRFNKLCESILELTQPDIHDLERKAQVLRDLRRLFGEPRIGHLPEVHQRLVVPKDHRLQLRVAVEAEAAHDGTVEVAHQPVGQEE